MFVSNKQNRINKNYQFSSHKGVKEERRRIKKLEKEKPLYSVNVGKMNIDVYSNEIFPSGVHGKKGIGHFLDVKTGIIESVPDVLYTFNEEYQYHVFFHYTLGTKIVTTVVVLHKGKYLDETIYAMMYCVKKVSVSKGENIRILSGSMEDCKKITKFLSNSKKKEIRREIDNKINRNEFETYILCKEDEDARAKK